MTKKSYAKDEVQQILSKFTPEEQGALQAMAQLRVEHKLYQKQLVELKGAYDSLYAVMITLLHAQPEKELRIHRSQFLRFKHEYRIDQKVEGEEIVLRLKTFTDEVEK